MENTASDSITESARDDLLESIQDNLKHFETVHPAATDILNRIAIFFSNMGI